MAQLSSAEVDGFGVGSADALGATEAAADGAAALAAADGAADVPLLPAGGEEDRETGHRAALHELPARQVRQVGDLLLAHRISSRSIGGSIGATGQLGAAATGAPSSATTKVWSGDHVSCTASPGAHSSALVARSTFCS